MSVIPLRAMFVSAGVSLAMCGSAFAQDRPSTVTPTAKKGDTIAHLGLPPSVPACASCHGAAGEGKATAGFPRLAGLPSDYLSEQLAYFANGTRQQAVMSPIAKALPADARANVASYFASLSPPAPGPQKPSQDKAQQVDPLGENLALTGNWKNNVPACVSCHGDRGSGVGAHFPALAGQPAAYIHAQLAAWKSGTRGPGPLGMMGAIASRLSDKEANAVAEYFASLPAAAQPATQPVSQNVISGATR